MSPRKSPAKSAASAFTPEERAAMRERARELKSAARQADGEREVLERIAAMAPPDRALAEGIHALVRSEAPGLEPRLWYGMPAYARDGQVLCHFQDAGKFKTRYATFAFSDAAQLDEGALYPVAFALREWNAEVAARLAELLRRAVG